MSCYINLSSLVSGSPDNNGTWYLTAAPGGYSGTLALYNQTTNGGNPPTQASNFVNAVIGVGTPPGSGAFLPNYAGTIAIWINPETLANGNYTFTYYVGSVPCEAQTDVTITVADAPFVNVNPGALTVCDSVATIPLFGPYEGLSLFTTSNDGGGMWGGGAVGEIINPNLPTASFSPSSSGFGTYTFTYTITEDGGGGTFTQTCTDCSATNTLTITVVTQADAGTGGSALVCV